MRSRHTSCELVAYTHALYDARELAIERLQDEAEALAATGIVGVTVAERRALRGARARGTSATARSRAAR